MNAIALLVLQALIKYGPEFAKSVAAIVKKQDFTVEDVETLFDKVKPYEAYGIPEIVSTAKP